MDEVELRKQVSELRRVHRELYLSVDKKTVAGTIYIECDAGKNNFGIKILIPDDYPSKAPKVIETTNKTSKNYHKFESGILCLETPYRIFEIFSRNKTLINFVDNLVAPYFAGWIHLTKYGKSARPGHAHGSEGLASDYADRFGANNYRTVLELLYFLAVDFYYGRDSCPCGSGKKYMRCHGAQLNGMHDSGYAFCDDLCHIMSWLHMEKKFNIKQYLKRNIWYYVAFDFNKLIPELSDD